MHLIPRRWLRTAQRITTQNKYAPVCATTATVLGPLTLTLARSGYHKPPDPVIQVNDQIFGVCARSDVT